MARMNIKNTVIIRIFFLILIIIYSKTIYVFQFTINAANLLCLSVCQEIV